MCSKGAPFCPPHKRATLTASRLRVVLASSLSVLCAQQKTPAPLSLGFLCFGSRVRHWLPPLLSSLIAPIPLSRAWSAAPTSLMGQSPLCHGGNISRLVTLGATLWGTFGGLSAFDTPSEAGSRPAPQGRLDRGRAGVRAGRSPRRPTEAM